MDRRSRGYVRMWIGFITFVLVVVIDFIVDHRSASASESVRHMDVEV